MFQVALRSASLSQIRAGDLLGSAHAFPHVLLISEQMSTDSEIVYTNTHIYLLCQRGLSMSSTTIIFLPSPDDKRNCRLILLWGISMNQSANTNNVI